MIHALRRKIIIVLMTIFTLILFGILVTINIANYSSAWHRSGEIFEKIMKTNGGAAPESPEEEEEQNGSGHNLKLIQFYIIMLDQTGSVKSILNQGEVQTQDSALFAIADKIWEIGASRGTLENYEYQLELTNDGSKIVLVENKMAQDQLHSLTFLSVILGLGGFCVIVVVTYFLSGWIVKPVAETFEKQKQFVSDASHELKTPLTIINANIEMMEHEYGHDKYFGYVQGEIAKMTSLINQLLSLAKVESTEEKKSHSKFNLSQAVWSACLPFESVAFEKEVLLIIEIQEELVISGNADQIKQLVAILLDNAIMHTKEAGSVTIKLVLEKGKHLLFVENEGDPIPEQDREKIFERFYRSDKARNRNEARYGLGLSIAKSIVDAHHGKIQVDSNKGLTIFQVKL